MKKDKKTKTTAEQEANKLPFVLMGGHKHESVNYDVYVKHYPEDKAVIDDKIVDTLITLKNIKLDNAKEKNEIIEKFENDISNENFRLSMAFEDKSLIDNDTIKDMMNEFKKIQKPASDDYDVSLDVYEKNLVLTKERDVVYDDCERASYNIAGGMFAYMWNKYNLDTNSTKKFLDNCDTKELNGVVNVSYYYMQLALSNSVLANHKMKQLDEKIKSFEEYKQKHDGQTSQITPEDKLEYLRKLAEDVENKDDYKNFKDAFDSYKKIFYSSKNHIDTIIGYLNKETQHVKK